jgi:hypothetical protein
MENILALEKHSNNLSSHSDKVLDFFVSEQNELVTLGEDGTLLIRKKLNNKKIVIR